MEKHSTPLADATTPSLEALKAYSTGMKLTVVRGSAAAIPLFRRAVDIDPKFAMVYAVLGLAYSSSGESVLSAESTTKAWQLRDRVSDREQFFIDFAYYRQVTGNLEKAYQTLELWLQTYPRGNWDVNPLGLLGGLSTHGTGRFERAIDASQKAHRGGSRPGAWVCQSCVQLFPHGPVPGSGERTSTRLRTQAGIADFSAHPIQHRAVERRPGSDGPGDGAGQRKADRGTLDGSRWMLSPWLDPAACRLARQSSSQAMELALQQGQREAAASYQAARAVWEALCGNAAEGKRNAMAALALSNGRDVEYAGALALALSGDSSRSQPLADDLEKRFPEDTFVKFTYVPVLRALSALADGKPADSLERLQIALPYELAVNGLNFSHFYLGGLHSAYVRGEALLAAHRYAEAAAEFQKILAHRGSSARIP